MAASCCGDTDAPDSAHTQYSRAVEANVVIATSVTLEMIASRLLNSVNAMSRKPSTNGGAAATLGQEAFVRSMTAINRPQLPALSHREAALPVHVGFRRLHIRQSATSA